MNSNRSSILSVPDAPPPQAPPPPPPPPAQQEQNPQFDLAGDVGGQDVYPSETASVRTSTSAGTRLSSYAGDINQNHVQYILVAEFALKGGPSMEHQYPTEISGDEQ